MSMGSKKTILKRTTAYVLAFVMAFSLLFTGNNAVTASAASAVTKITVKKKSVTIEPKKTVNVGVTVKGGNKKFTAKSSNKKIATVKVVGKKVRITAKNKIGKATITVTTKGKNKKGKTLKAKIKVNVANATTEATTEDQAAKNKAAADTVVNSLNSLPASTTVTVNDEAKITDARKAYDALTAEQKALVPADVVKKLTDAEAALAEAKNAAGTTGAVTSVAFDKATYSLETGASVQALVTVLPADAKDKTVTYKSSDVNVATVTAAGIIIGGAEGTATITATCGGKTATATVEVKSPATLGLSSKTLEIAKGKEATLTTTVDGVTWSSDKPEVATVSDKGVVTGIAAGTAIITAKLGNTSESCTVTVSQYSTENDGITLSVSNPIKNNDGSVIENTCLINQDMELQAYVQNNSSPVKGAEVKLVLTPIDSENCSPSNFFTMSKGVATDIAVTDDSGIAKFTIRPDGWGTIPSTYDDIDDCPYASFLVQTTVTNLGNEEDIQVKFGSVLRNGIYVENNEVDNVVSRPTKAAPNNEKTVYNNLEDLDIDDIVPFDGAPANDDGIYQSWNTNDYYPVQYVSSQQVPHDVTLSATPYFVLPPERHSSEDKFEVTFGADGKGTVASGQSDVSVKGPGRVDSYTIYNDGTDMTTTTQVINVPAGLVSMSVFFDKISISKYSQLYVDLYEGDGEGGYGKLVYSKSYGNKSKEYVETFGKESGVPIENVNTMTRKGILVVSIQSPGQVDVSTTGYVLSKVEGDYNTATKSGATMIEVVDSVEWTDVTSYARYTAPEELTFAEISALLPEYVGKENTYLVDNANYTFAKRLPVFQANSENANAMTGNALLTATYTPTSGQPKTATFAYPTVRKTEWDSTKHRWTLNNTNELVKKTADVKAIFLGNDVIDANGDIQQKTGGITRKGNLAIVKPASNNVSGAAFIQAKLKVNALDKEISIANKTNDYEKNPLRGAESKYPLYTYVQFVAKPEAGIVADEIPTFHAVEDQFIIVSAEIRADNNEVQTDQPVKFKIGSTTLTTADIGKVFGKNATLRYLDEKTDGNGRARAIFLGDSDSYINYLEVETTSTFKTFKTFVGFGAAEQELLPTQDSEGKLHNRAKLEWLDLGLAYLDSIDGGTWLYSYPSGTHEDTASSSKVGKKWDVGFLPCAYSPLGTFKSDFATLWKAKRDLSVKPKKVFAGITNVGVSYKFEGTTDDNIDSCVDKQNDVSSIYSEKTGETNVRGNLNLKDSVFEVSYYDAEGELQKFKTVGVNAYDFNNKKESATLVPGGEIQYTMTWEPGEWDPSFVCPYGIAPSTTQDTYVYFLLRDKYNNPVVNQAVDIKATFKGTAYTGFSVSGTKTNGDGIVKITVPAPSQAGELIFTAKADEETKVSNGIVYQVETEADLAFTTADPEIKAATPKKVSLKLNNIVTDKLTDAMLKKLVVVKDKDNKELLIDTITLNEKTLTITLAENTFIENSNYTVEIKTDNTCTIDGVTYVLYDTYGQAIKAANAKKAFTAKIKQ